MDKLTAKSIGLLAAGALIWWIVNRLLDDLAEGEKPFGLLFVRRSEIGLEETEAP